MIAFKRAQEKSGAFLLRIEDIDQTRSRQIWEDRIFDDLSWIGIRWDQPVLRQSERLPAYRDALTQLADLNLLYPCCCKRADIKAALSAPQEGTPIHGPDGLIYPGTCRSRSIASAGQNDAIRLNMQAALDLIEQRNPLISINVQDTGPIYDGKHIYRPDHFIHAIGDVVLARRDMGTSYHLSVVIDDAAQEITEVVRGEDLWEATPLHRLLQMLLGLAPLTWHHHDLIRDDTGKRLAKRDDARALRTYRDAGETPTQVLARIGLSPLS